MTIGKGSFADSGQARLGFVGLGTMGQAMAGRLAAATTSSIFVYDVRSERTEPLVAAGATLCGSPQEVANSADVVFVSLPTPTVVHSVVTAPGGLLEGERISTYVDFSTTGKVTAQRISALLAARNIDYVDAPVSGGPGGASTGKLTVMTSGDKSACDRILPYLRHVAANVVWLGETPGMAQIAKLINNMLSAVAIASTAEVLTLGVACGLDPRLLLEVINSSSGRNTATAEKFPRHVINRAFDFGFRLQLMAKDVGLCLDEAKACGVPMLLGSQFQQLWSLAANSMPEDADATSITLMFEQWAGVVIESKT